LKEDNSIEDCCDSEDEGKKEKERDFGLDSWLLNLDSEDAARIKKHTIRAKGV